MKTILFCLALSIVAFPSAAHAQSDPEPNLNPFADAERVDAGDDAGVISTGNALSPKQELNCSISPASRAPTWPWWLVGLAAAVRFKTWRRDP